MKPSEMTIDGVAEVLAEEPIGGELVPTGHTRTVAEAIPQEYEPTESHGLGGKTTGGGDGLSALFKLGMMYWAAKKLLG